MGKETGFFGGRRPYVIAGPCSAESEEQVMATAGALKSVGVSVFRAGLWKPRTLPGSFEGVGEAGIPWLKRVQRELGMKVCTEVAGERHVEAVLDAGLDMVWVGSRTTVNPFMVEEIARSLDGRGIPVMIKNPVNPDINLWIGAVERMMLHGVEDIALIHRGFSTSGRTGYRNSPEWQVAIEMHRRYPGFPFFCDPSHMGGDRSFVGEISQMAMDLGLDGLMIESHCDPDSALSDSRQQISPSALGKLLSALSVRVADTDDVSYRRELCRLRAGMDMIDESLVDALASRMEISRSIGRLKKDNNVAILQVGRWEEVMDHVESLAGEKGLDPALVNDIFSEIHRASIAEQNKILDIDDSQN